MTTTPRLGITQWEDGQAMPETTGNEALRVLEAVAARVVVDKDRTAPAGTENDGDVFIVPASPTGAWAGKADYIAVKISTAWWFLAPFAGLTFFVQDEAVNYRYSGSAWASVAGGGTAASLDYDTDGTLAANSDSKIATQKATKTYVDGKIAGLSWKQAVRVATTANGTLSSAYENGDTVDGVTLATGDRILIKNQTTGSENGIFIVNASGAPTRATDADSGAELVNASVYVSEGTANADTQWTCSTNAPITVGSTSLTFVKLNTGAGDMLASNNLSDVASIIAAADHLFTKGTDIASASTTDLATATGNFVDVTGTTTITALGTLAAGVERTLRFTGALTLTYNATSLILPTAANITTAAGDVARFRSLGSGNWVCIAYQRANGQPLASAAATPNIQSVTSSATVTPTFSNDQVNITAQAAGLTLANPTGTAVDGWGLSIRIKDNGTARSITFGSQYRAIGVTLPTTTVISKTLYLGMIYNAADTKWDVVAVAQEA